MNGNIYGSHRVLEPKGVLPQPAWALDNDFSVLYDNEVLFDVDTLNIDAASFLNLEKRADGDPVGVGKLIKCIVATRGKMHNPETGSGGMFLGTVAKIGKDFPKCSKLEVGDRVASLVSLSLTPLHIEEILKIHMGTDKVDIKGQAVLFESGIFSTIPDDLPEDLVLSVLDVAGAAAQTDRIVWPGDRVAVLGARGKSGMLCCYQAKKRGAEVIAVVHSTNGIDDVLNAPFIDHVVVASADNALDLLEKIEKLTKGDLCDVVISCVSRPNCEMGAILITDLGGTIYFFSMATDFTKAALGAEGVGKDIDMLIGNGYCLWHVDTTLDIIRESDYIRDLYTRRYCYGEDR
jgi:L-erythro-3,5-diaminohexanoate dehydrogenase